MPSRSVTRDTIMVKMMSVGGGVRVHVESWRFQVHWFAPA
jgi:hypothetical protein